MLHAEMCAEGAIAAHICCSEACAIQAPVGTTSWKFPGKEFAKLLLWKIHEGLHSSSIANRETEGALV